MSEVTVIQAEAIETMATLPAQSVNAIITDLPYGTTACKWDEIIPFAPMWAQVKRVLKPRGVFVTTASQPFTSKLVMSNLEWFKYEWIWDKGRPSGLLTAKTSPMKQHENILVFGINPLYNYQPRELPESGKKRNNRNRITKTKMIDTVYGSMEFIPPKLKGVDFGYPKTIIYFEKNSNNQFIKSNLHPTQKPVALYKYLILTYTNPGDVVLDFAAGSGTTAIAAIDTGRDCILVEKEPEYVEIIRRRVATAQMSPRLEGL